MGTATTTKRVTVLAVTAGLLLTGVACDSDGDSVGSGSDTSDEPTTTTTEAGAGAKDIGVDPATLTTTVDHPFVAFAQVSKAVFEGEEVDDETGETATIKVESTVQADTKTVGGIEVLVVEVKEYEDGELVEITEDYYAQDEDGVAYYMGESVNDYEGGKLVGHHGQWQAGQKGALAGVFMPVDPKVGDTFEQERAPGIAEDQSEVVEVDVTVEVPAGTFSGCIKTKDVDPIGDATEHKIYCPDVGLVQEIFPAGGTLDLVSYEQAG